MKEIMSKKDLYQSHAEKEKPRRMFSMSSVAIALVATFLFSFTFGVRAHEQGWLDDGPAISANAELPADLNFDSVEDVYDELRLNFDGVLDEQMLLDGLKHGLVEASGDEYTTYFNEEETESFFSGLNGSFEGIGAELGTEGDVVIVVAPIKGFPAEAAGLRPQDAIVAIDGEDAIGMSVEEAVTRIRGEAGTNVTLSIVRGEGERLEIEITREQITIPSVTWEYNDDNTIGILQISRFAEDTGSLAATAAREFKRNNVAGVILDVRSNSGGFVQAAIDVASLWLDRGEVVFEQRSGGESEGSITATGENALSGIPTAVLINEGSASASEIVAGALKDLNYAEIVGKTSFGKGSVQDLIELQNEGTLKVTTARWFTPAGVNISETGITPDVEVEFTEEDFENDRDPQQTRAIQVLQALAN